MESRRIAGHAIVLGVAMLGCQSPSNVQTGDVMGGLSLFSTSSKAKPAEPPKQSEPSAAKQTVAPKAKPVDRPERAPVDEEPIAAARPEREPLPWSIGHDLSF